MIETNIKCYIKNKLVYKIYLYMTKDDFYKQIKENKLMYMSTKTGNTEIVYLDKFDKIEFDKNIEL